MKLVGEVNIGDIEKIKSGKVREMFAFDDRMLIVTTDRISAFDYILPSLIPFKGMVLNSISNFWFDKLGSVIENHLLETDIEKFPKEFKKYKDTLRGRSVIVKKARIFPIECVVRGYITGSGWEEYKKSGSIGDIKLPAGLKMCDKLPEPVFPVVHIRKSLRAQDQHRRPQLSNDHLPQGCIWGSDPHHSRHRHSGRNDRNRQPTRGPTRS